MYTGIPKKNGPVELELVGEIPKSERLDADIVSPISYDDVFEVIPSSRGGKNPTELRVDISEDLKSHVAELLKFCGIDEFDDQEESTRFRDERRETYGKGPKSNRVPKARSLGPPFLVRLMRYNLLENQFPSFFDFGVNLTLPASFLVSEFRLLRTANPIDNPWHKGCMKLILLGIPSFLSSDEIAEIIVSFVKKPDVSLKFDSDDGTAQNAKSLSQKCFPVTELGIKSFTNLFTTENRENYLNQLYQPCGAIVNCNMNMAILEFQSEEEALSFWVSLSTGLLQCYGSVLTAIPDPSGRRIFAEGMLTVFSPVNVPLLDSVESNARDIIQKDYPDQSEAEIVLYFPLTGSSRSIDTLRSEIDQVFKDLSEPDKAGTYTVEEVSGCLTFRSNAKKAVEIANNRLFQHCSFKMVSGVDDGAGSPDEEDIIVVNTAMFIFGEKLCEPVVIEGSYDIHPIKHRTIEFEVPEATHERTSKVSFSSVSQSDPDTEPAGFLFKKFEELREALQHGLVSTPAQSDYQNTGSGQNPSSCVKGTLRTPSEVGMAGEPTTPKSSYNTVNMASKRFLGTTQLSGSLKDEQESFVRESSDSPPRRPATRKRAAFSLNDEYSHSPRDSRPPPRSMSGSNRDYARRSDSYRSARYTGKRRASAELSRRHFRSGSYKRGHK